MITAVFVYYNLSICFNVINKNFIVDLEDNAKKQVYKYGLRKDKNNKFYLYGYNLVDAE